MKSTINKTLALALSVSMLAAYTPGFAAERQVITEDTSLTGEEWSNLSTSGSAAAIYANTAAINVSITDSTFTGNHADGYAGAIWNRASMTLTNDSFTNNSSDLYGGAILGVAGDLTTNNTSFEGNTAQFGGAIFNQGTLNMNNSSATNNSATGSGGAIYNANGTTASITNTSFDSNQAADWGGAINNGDNVALTITDSTFTNNVAQSVGGAFGSGFDNVVTISGTSFSNNHAVYDGGALGLYSGFAISNSTFENNTAQMNQDSEGNWTVQVTDDDKPIGGGAISLGAVSAGTIVSVSNTTFKNNISGNFGGAIGTRHGDVADNSAARLDIAATFENNEAYEDGGAIYNTFYANNDLGKGDGVTVTGKFTENYAHQDGGAIYNTGDKDRGGAGNAAVMTVYDSTFSGNKADGNGGAIYNGGTLTLAGTNTFTGNTAAEGADIYNAGTLTINDTTAIDGGIAGDGTVNVNGTLNIGQAEVKAGTLAFANGSTLGVEFGNGKMGNLQANTITVGKNASDTAKLQVVLSKDFLTTDKTEHSLTNDTAVTNGKFAMADVTNALYNVSFDDSTNIVTAQRKSQEEQQDAINKAGGTSNDTTVLAAFTSASDLGNDTTNKVADIINTLAQTDTAKLVEVTKAVAPEVAPAKQVVHTAVLNEVFGALQHRMADASAASPAMYALGDAKDYNTADTKHFSVWTQGLLNKSHKEATSDAHAFTGRSTGIAAGADMKVGESGLVGLGYAYTHTNVSSTGRHDRILGDNFFLYGQYRPSAFYVQGSLAYGDSKYEESKSLPGMTLDADYHVQHYAMQGRVGYDVTDWFSPNMGLRYTRLHQEGYTDGAQNVSADNSNYFTGMLGADFQTQQRLSQHVCLLPHLYTGVSYDLKSDDNNSRVTLPNATGYNVTGERLHRLAFEVGAGVTARLYHSVEMSLGYEGSFRQDYNSHTGTLKLRYLF